MDKYASEDEQQNVSIDNNEYIYFLTVCYINILSVSNSLSFSHTYVDFFLFFCRDKMLSITHEQ